MMDHKIDTNIDSIRNVVAFSKLKKSRKQLPLETFKTNISPPIKPTCDEYGISQNDFDWKYGAKLERFDTDWYFKYLVKPLSVCYILFVIYYTYSDWAMGWNVMILFVVFIFGIWTLLVSIVIPLIGFLIVESLKIIVKLFSVHFVSPELHRRIRAFDSANKKYSNDLIVYENQVKNELKNFQLSQKNFWLNLTGYEFEHMVGELMTKDGYNVHVTQGSGDGGVDLYLKKNGVETPVQCKNHSNKVSVNDIRAFYGVLVKDGFEKGIMIGSSGFSKSSIKFNDRIEFWDVDKLVKIVDRLSKQ